MCEIAFGPFWLSRSPELGTIGLGSNCPVCFCGKIKGVKENHIGCQRVMNQFIIRYIYA